MNHSSISALEILQIKGSFEHQLYECVSLGLLSDRVCRLFSVWCYRDTLVWNDTPDPRSISAVNGAEDFANGKIGSDKLRQLWCGACDAARELLNKHSIPLNKSYSDYDLISDMWCIADSASSAAASADANIQYAIRNAARSSAWSAAHKAKTDSNKMATRTATELRQKKELIRLLKEELQC